MWSSLRRATAAAVCFSLIATCAGLEPYAAFGASFRSGPDLAPVQAPALPQLPSIAVPLLPAAAIGSGLPSVTLTAAPSALSAPVLPAASAVAPQSQAQAPAAAAPRGQAAVGAELSARQQRVAEAVDALACPQASAEDAQAAGRRLDGELVRGGQLKDAVAASAPQAGAAAARPAPLSKAQARAARASKSLPAVRRFMSDARHRARGFFVVATLSVALAMAGVAGRLGLSVPTLPVQAMMLVAQAGTPPPAAAPAAQAPAPAPIVLSKDLSASVRFDAQGMKVGERLHVIVTVKNETAKPVTIVGLRESVNDALPESLEIQPAAQPEPPLTLKPGESREVAFEAIPFDSGDIQVVGPLTLSAQDAQGQAADLSVAMAPQTLKVTSILTPDWKKKGFRDVAPVMKRAVPEWVWLVALPLLAVLLIGVERVLAAQREFPRLPAKKVPLIVRARERLAALSAKLDAPERVFYAEFDSILTGFLVDFHGLTTAERSPEALAAALKGLRSLSPGQQRVAADLLVRAETARFSGSPASAAERKRDLANLSDLIDSIGGKSDGAAPKPGADTLSGAAALQFGHPLALLLFIPLIARGVWAFMNRGKSQAFNVSDGAALPRGRTLRQKLSGLPKVLRYAAVAGILLGLAGPQLGVRRDVVWRPSTDTMIEFDVSGSMDESVGQNLSKLQAAGEAVKGYIDEQRRGTDNRVGMGTFSDNAYLDVRLTTDYDALIAHLKELHTLGSTAIGKSILDGTAHFIELNITELSDPNDARMAEAQKILREQGLPAVLEWAKQYPDLMQKILRPDRAKVIVLFTDGDSNTGITPHDAALIAKSLGVKVYTVFIGPNGASGIAPLQEVSAITGAKFYRAADPDAMRSALLEVDKLEKSPSRVVSSLSLQDYSRWFILMALLALGLEVALGNTRLRALQAMVFLSLPLGQLPGLPQNIANPAAITAQVRAPSLPVQGVPKEVADANLLYNEGRFDEALKAYDAALALYPDLPELYFNMGNAYFKLGELDKSAASYQRFLGKTKDPRFTSRAIYNLSMIALAKKDAAQAKDMLKESLRRDAGNEDARWNLEVLNQLQKEQQKQQNQQQKPQKGKKGQKGQPQQGQPQPGDPNGDKQKGPPQAGNQQGQPQPNDPKAGDEKKSPAEKLGDKLAEQQKEQQDAARKALPRKGKDAWGALALPVALAGGTALTFSAPLWAWAAAIAAPIVALALAYGLNKRLQAARALSPGSAPKDFKSWWGRRRFLRKTALVSAAAGLLMLAAGNPQSGYKDERVNFGGKDVIVAVDGSNSEIYAEDGRFDKTKRELADFAERLQGTDRVGLIVFAGEPRTASPLSVDYGNLQFKAERLELESRGLQSGTKLAAAVEHAAKSFETAKNIGERERILVVVSDGEIFGEDLEAAIAAARAHHVTIYAIGVGTERGVRMKIPTEDGKGTEYVQDEAAGGPALTKLDEAPLRKLASATGGRYFRGGDGATLSKVMERVAEANKGEKSESIRSPRGVAEIFLWPALMLLLLDLMLPGFSVVKREEKAKDKTSKLHGGAFAMLGAALLPLSSWPVVLPFALAAAALGGLLAADLWTDGALTRKLVWAAQRRRGVVAKGLAADLPRLFSVRDIDHERLALFLKAWQAAPDAARPAMIAEAAADPELARQKLIAAYLAGAAPEVSEKALTELGRAARRQLKPVAPVLREVLAQKDALSWLRHADAAQALGRLSQAFLEPADAAAARAGLGLDRPAPSWSGLKRAKRVALAAALLVAVGSLTLGGAAGFKTVEYADEKAKAAEATTQIFFSEDAFIFSDRYVDDRIPQIALPALRRWSSGSPGAQEELERAVTLLTTSPDPKADNILEAILRRSDLLPLNDSAEKTLLTALVLRDNDHVWRFMDELMEKSAGNPKMTARLETMLVIALNAHTPRAFENAFHFLKSPDEDLRGFAARAIFATLLEYGKSGQFYDRLGAAQARYAADPELDLWAERFLLMQAAGGKDAGFDAAKSRALLDALMDSGVAYDAARAPALMAALQAAAKAQQAGQQAPQLETPPSLTQAEFAMLGEAIAKPDAPQALKDLAKAEVNAATTKLIKEAEAQYPELHKQLIELGVVLPDTEESYGGEYEIYEGRGMGGGSSTTQHYRELYKLQHLRALQDQIAADAKAADSAKITPALVELLDRSANALPEMQKTGKAAGMLDGGSAAEKAADDVNVVLADGVSKFANGLGFVKGLRALGLAPDNGATSGETLYAESYTAAQLEGVRAYLLALAASGRSVDNNGKPQPLTVNERKYLAGAIGKLDALAAKHYGVKAPKTVLPPSLTVVQLSLQAEAAAGKPEQERALLKQLLAFAGSRQGAAATREELADALDKIFAGVPDAAGKAALAGDLAAAAQGQPAVSPLAVAAEAQLVAQINAQITALTGAFDKLGETLVAQHLRPSAYSNYSHYKVLQLKRLLALVQAQAAATPAQEQALKAAAALLPRFIELAPKVGMMPGDTPGELAADKINTALYQDYMKFYGQIFKKELVKSGLAPDNGVFSAEDGYAQSYGKADLQKVLAFLEEIKASGNGWADDTVRRPLTADETKVLDASLAAVRAAIQEYPAGPSPVPGGKTAVHGAALVGLALAAPSLGLLWVALAVGAWYLYKRWSADDGDGPARAEARKRGASDAARARAKRVELAAKRLASSVAGGSFRSLFIGAGGSDFAESRQYQGEDRRDIDWKATAKQGEVYAKKYELEKEMPLMLVVDVSGSGAFGTRGADKGAVIEDVASVLALAAANLNMRVGAVLVSDKIEAYIPPKNGAGQAQEIVKRLQALPAEPRRTDLRPALDLVLKELRSRAVVAVVSDFLAPDFKGSLSAAAKRHDVRLIRVADPAELRPLPDVGLLAVRDGETGELRQVDTSDARFRGEHSALIERREGRLADAFTQARLRPLVLSTEADYLQELQDAFDPKAAATRSTP